jgi:hypothetical protein
VSLSDDGVGAAMRAPAGGGLQLKGAAVKVRFRRYRRVRIQRDQGRRGLGSFYKRTFVVNSEILLLNYRGLFAKLKKQKLLIGFIESQTKLLWNFKSVAAKDLTSAVKEVLARPPGEPDIEPLLVANLVARHRRHYLPSGAHFVGAAARLGATAFQ